MIAPRRRLTRRAALSVAGAAIPAFLLAPVPGRSAGPPTPFTGRDAALGLAIEADDPGAVEAALRAGANANARGARGAAPVEYAVGRFKKRAAAALLQHGANPNQTDDDGDSAVSLAVVAYKRDPALLGMVLDAGGNPNAKRPGGDPVIVRFVNDRNLPAITYLHSRGAGINTLAGGRPLVVDAAFAEDWDVAWHLIQLGADIDAPRTREAMVFAFKNPAATPPDSPLYPAKVAAWRALVAKGANPVPPMGMAR